MADSKPLNNRRGFRDPKAALHRLTPIAQVHRARIESGQSLSGNNPFQRPTGCTLQIKADAPPAPDPTKNKARSAEIKDNVQEQPDYQARIGNGAIGSLSTNWHRTKHTTTTAAATTPATPDTSDIAELHAQRIDKNA
jgi:hypothetical protein